MSHVHANLCGRIIAIWSTRIYNDDDIRNDGLIQQHGAARPLTRKCIQGRCFLALAEQGLGHDMMPLIREQLVLPGDL